MEKRGLWSARCIQPRQTSRPTGCSSHHLACASHATEFATAAVACASLRRACDAPIDRRLHARGCCARAAALRRREGPNPVAIIDPNGLFGGDRLRRCSNLAQLHWPRLFLASDGYARLEINYAKIIGRAYSTFNPFPSDSELSSWIEEYARNYLLFVYSAGGQLWGQWDTRSELLPRYKTAQDRRSPVPPEPQFTHWKRKYRDEKTSFPKSFSNVSEGFLYGVGVGGGKYIGASGDAQVFLGNDTLQAEAHTETEQSEQTPPPADGFAGLQRSWFEEWWPVYWRKRDRKRAWIAFKKVVRRQETFDQVMAATRAQKPEMLSKDEQFRPHGATWLNGERWNDEISEIAPLQPSSGSNYTKWEPPIAGKQ